MFVAVGEDGPCSFAATHSTYFLLLFFLYYCNQYGWLSFGHRFVYTRGLCDQFYRTSSTISDHLDNYAKCVRSCCNCSKIHRRSRVLHDHVSAVDLDPDSCELNGPTCCSCSSMDRLVTGCSRGQYARCRCICNTYRRPLCTHARSDPSGCICSTFHDCAHNRVHGRRLHRFDYSCDRHRLQHSLRLDTHEQNVPDGCTCNKRLMTFSNIVNIF